MNQGGQSLTKKCPFCTEEILAEAVKCEHCGEWLDKRAAYSAWARTGSQRFSNAQPVWQFVLLALITFGIYEIYWFYRNWKHLKFHNNLDISPGWRTVGLFVPILNIVLIYKQFKNIRDFTKEAGCDIHLSPGWITVSYIALGLLANLPDPFWLLGFLGVVPLAVVQGVLNSYWEKEQSQLVVRKGLSGGQVALLVFGAIFWIIVLIGTFIPEPFPDISY